MKLLTLSSGVPAILSLQTQKIIEVIKQKEVFSLKNYQEIRDTPHFFIGIDNPHHDEELLAVLKASNIVASILHVQGDCSFVIEIIAKNYEDYKKLLRDMKTLSTVHHIETREVIAVEKYRNHIVGARGELVKPETDTREIYTL